MRISWRARKKGNESALRREYRRQSSGCFLGGPVVQVLSSKTNGQWLAVAPPLPPVPPRRSAGCTRSREPSEGGSRARVVRRHAMQQPCRASGLGTSLLGLTRQGRFMNNPVVTLLDEAHHFLDRSVGDEFSRTDLDAFGLIAKEGRKYSLKGADLRRAPSSSSPGAGHRGRCSPGRGAGGASVPASIAHRKRGRGGPWRQW